LKRHTTEQNVERGRGEWEESRVRHERGEIIEEKTDSKIKDNEKEKGSNEEGERGLLPDGLGLKGLCLRKC
jgi:hypothetical protein